MEVEDEVGRFSSIAQQSPVRALQVLPQFLAGQDDHRIRSRLFRTAALAARESNDLARSNSFLDEAVEEAIEGQDSIASTEALLTKSYNVFLQGDSEAAIALVSSLAAPDDARLDARIQYQHATILARSGHVAESKEQFQRSVEFAETAEDWFLLAQLQKNLGMLAVESGEAVEARQRFLKARELFGQLDADIDVAFIDNNLGYAATNLGDLPEAFSRFRRASEKLIVAAGSDFESRAGHCRALISAGLFHEAAALADESAQQCIEADNMIDGAEMKLLAAGAWLEAGRSDVAGTCAREAAALFESQARPGRRAGADLIDQSIRYRGGEALEVSEVVGTIDRLLSAELHREVMEAKLLLLELHVSLEDWVSASSLLEEMRLALSDAPVDLGLALATAEAVYLQAIGDGTRARERAVSGYRLLAEQQSLLGAADLRIGLRRHAERLAVIGITTSVQSENAWLVLDWQERVHLTLGSPRPIRPQGGEQLQRALAKLRAVDRMDIQQRRQQEEVVRLIDRSAHPPDQDPFEPRLLTQLIAQLGTTGAVSLSGFDEQVIATALAHGQPTSWLSGRIDEVERTVRSLRSDLRRRATKRASEAAGRRIHKTLDRLDELLQPVELPEAVVLVPPPSLVALPWSLLPSRTRRPTTVATSLNAWASTATAAVDVGSAVFVSGPGLDHSEQEVQQLANTTDLTTATLVGDSATVDQVLSAIDGASVAHIVAHGTVRTDNPLFSSLRMADGELSVYELAELTQAPSLVVLSACHVGLPAEAPGQELLGMVTGFLNAGTSCVLASTLPVPDNESTIDMMTRFHRFLGEGMGPAAAWAEVQQTCRDEEQLLDAAAFTVFGRG